MDTTVENISGLIEPDRKTTLQIPFPVDLQDWATRNEPMISRLSQSIKVVSTPLTENALWNIIAENFSGDWKEKHTELLRTEKRLAQLMSPENMPLGLVGAALHSDETNAATQQHVLALADFTIVNETLRQQRELHHLLGAMMHYHQTVTQSLDLSKNMAGLSAAFDEAIDNTPDAGTDFDASAKKTPGLSLSFKSIAAKLLKKPSSPAATAKAPRL